METPSCAPHEVRLSDLGAAALLVSEGCRLVDVANTDEPGRKAFVLVGDRVRIDELLAAFERGDAVVALEPFLDAQRRLKQRVFRSERIGRAAR